MTSFIPSQTLFLEKNILSNTFSYAAVGALILLLIIILPCIVRILWQSIQKLETELAPLAGVQPQWIQGNSKERRHWRIHWL